MFFERHKIIFLLVWVWAACGSATAQAKFYASAPKSVPVNQGFQLTYTLENANGGNLQLPSLNDFQLIGGPNTSSNIQWINGRTTQSVSYTYILKPKKEGTFTIGKGSIKVEGVTMSSNELTIDVTQAVAQSQNRQRQRNPFDPFDDPFFNQDDGEDDAPQANSADLEKQLKSDVFVKLLLSKNSAYKGEMLTATYRLYFRQNLSGFNITQAPSFEGFWSQEVDLDPKRRPSVETINGKQYNSIDILQYHLYPQRAGTLPIAPTEVSTTAQVAVRRKSHGFFDNFFNMGAVQQVPLELKTNGASVKVKELPQQGQPAGFDGAVGKFNFQVSLSSTNAKTGEPITYSVKVSGTGNMKFIEPPKVNIPPSFEVYDPKTKENITNGASGLSGTKQYDYLIIPRQPGDYTIAGQQFSYFNPDEEKYITINSPEFAVKVTGAPSQDTSAGAAVASNQKDVSLIGQDIHYIKTEMPTFRSSNSFADSITFAALYVSPFLLFLGLIALKRRNENLAADLVGAKRRRALKLAKKRLSAANKLLSRQDKKGFYREVSQALWGYLGDKLNIDMAALSKDNVEEKLVAREVPAETVVKLKNLLHICDLALYAPVGEGSEMKQNYDAAMNLIADFEDEIKNAKPKIEASLYSAIFLLLSFAIALPLCSQAQTPQQTYSSANALYQSGQYEQAAAAYEKLLTENYKSAEVYYNLGNCYYKLNKIAPSIVNYERARRYNASDEDILHNLKLAQLKTVDKIEAVPQLSIITWWNGFTASKTAKGWGIIAIVFSWLALLTFAAYLFTGYKRLSGWAGSLLLFLSFAFLALALKQSKQETKSNLAVLMSEESYVKSAPDNNGSNLFLLHEGAEFHILDQVGAWHKIRLADGKTGWIERRTFTRI